MSALKRVEAFVESGWFVPTSAAYWEMGDARLTIADLRAVLALAKSTEELRRRVRLAREAALGQCVSRRLWDLLDLRKPVARGAVERRHERPRRRHKLPRRGH